MPARLVKITGSKGKFDFLDIDSVNHRLLAVKEREGTADFFDLNIGAKFARIKPPKTLGSKMT